jgi:hypothetical protein
MMRRRQGYCQRDRAHRRLLSGQYGWQLDPAEQKKR